MPSNDEPTRRWIMLGASNLTRGLATAVTIARRTHRAPLDIMSAPGNGRSYGWYARILGRGLPSIIDCGLWRDLAARPRLPTTALLTDIGNDVMYGAHVEDILRWIETCLERLTKYEAELILTGLPLANLATIGPIRYQTFRRLLFPRNRDSLARVTERAHAVDAGARRLAEKYGAAFVEPRAEWYGLDPIHYVSAHWRTVWREFLLHDSGPTPLDLDSPSDIGAALDRSYFTWARTQFWMPEERWLFGIAQRRAQPSVSFDDGTRISLY